MEASATQTRTERYRSVVKEIILTKLGARRVRKLRKIYSEGKKTIADLSRETETHPVLLWSALTPLHEKTQLKRQLLCRETKIYDLLAKGHSFAEIAKAMLMSEKEVRNYTVDQFLEAMFQVRPWYNNQIHAQCDKDDVDVYAQIMGDHRPPTSLLGQQRGDLMTIAPDELGRCPTCGRLGRIPCYECALKEYLKNNEVPAAREVLPEEDTEERLPELMFR